MFADDAQRLNREDWGAHVNDQSDFIQALAAGLAALRDSVAGAVGQVSLPHESLPPPQPTTAPGITMAMQELSLLVGKDKPLTHRAGLTVEETQPDAATAEYATLQVNAYKNNPDATDAVAINTNGLIYENGVRVAGASGLSARMAMIWLDSVASIPAGWALCDGVANSLANGGSGKNLVGSFLKAAGTTLGAQTAATATASGTANLSDHTKAQVVATIAAHTSHTHSTPVYSHAGSGVVELSHSAHSAHAGTGSNITHSASASPDPHQHAFSGLSYSSVSNVQTGGSQTVVTNINTAGSTGTQALTITVSDHTPASIAAVLSDHNNHSNHSGAQVAATLADHAASTTGGSGSLAHTASAGADLSHTDTGHTHPNGGEPACWEVCIIEKLT